MASYELKLRSSKMLCHLEYDHPDHDIPPELYDKSRDSWVT